MFRNRSLLILIALLVPHTLSADERYDKELDDISDDLRVTRTIEPLETALTDGTTFPQYDGYVLRSKHFVFGMPRLIDNRHNLESGQPSVSLLVREGFVIGHFDRMRSPLWVSQRWAKDELEEDKPRVPSLDRDWKKDPELPAAVRIGVSYAGNTTKLDRGHMAKHSMNRAWGRDTSVRGCLMSNSTPQHKNINRPPGAWARLEEEVENVVGRTDIDIDVLWTISGAIFRDKTNPGSETPEQDFAAVERITAGFGVPDATYKIVAWFTSTGVFRARGYVFEQPHSKDGTELSFEIPDQSSDLTSFIVPINEIQQRAGVDFFPLLKDDLENPLESTRFVTMWSSN